MAFDIGKILTVGLFAEAAYTFDRANQTYPIPLNYTLVGLISGNDLATDIGGPKQIVPFGFIAQSPPPAVDFVVSIRGTTGIWEWIQDARFLKIPFPFVPGAGSTEDGFTDVYASLSAGPGGSSRVATVLKQIAVANPNATLTITGHSLGAALATLLALEVSETTPFTSPHVVTFASPLVGDTQFARTYNSEVANSVRVANVVDVVPKLPPSFWGFDHVDSALTVNSFLRAKLLPACAHSLATYLYLLDQSIGGNTFKLETTCVW